MAACVALILMSIHTTKVCMSDGQAESNIPPPLFQSWVYKKTKNTNETSMLPFENKKLTEKLHFSSSLTSVSSTIFYFIQARINRLPRIRAFLVHLFIYYLCIPIHWRKFQILTKKIVSSRETVFVVSD